VKYDAVIVGASIAGLYAGMKLAQNNWRVCIVDRRAHIGMPVRCGEATGNRAELARFVTLDESWIAREVRGLTVHLNDTHTFTREIPGAGLVLRRDRFERQLAHAAQRNGAQIILNTLAIGLERGNRTVQGIMLENGSVVEASVVVGADGAESNVGQWAGITKPLTLQEAFSSVQYTFESDFPSDGFLHFYVGSRIIPKGYIWAFPKADHTISVGAGLFGTHHALPKARHFLDAFVSSKLPGTAPGAPITGCVPLAVCPTLLARQNVVVVGDAARQCNPLTAGGIMNALEAADLAANRLLQCGRPPKTLKPLGRYSCGWARKPRREQKLFLVLQKAFLSLSDAEIARAIATASTVFAGRLDRSRPFTFPLLKSVRMFIAFLPRVARHLGVLFE